MSISSDKTKLTIDLDPVDEIKAVAYVVGRDTECKYDWIDILIKRGDVEVQATLTKTQFLKFQKEVNSEAERLTRPKIRVAKR